MNTTCPTCSSTDTQSFHMVHQTGSTQGKMSLGTYSQGGGLGVAGGKIKTQTMLAASAMPPQMHNEGMEIVLLIGAGLLVFGLVFSLLQSVTITLVAVAIAASFAAPVFYFGYVKVAAPMIVRRRAGFQELYDHWASTWVCLRCGANWQIRR